MSRESFIKKLYVVLWKVWNINKVSNFYGEFVRESLVSDAEEILKKEEKYRWKKEKKESRVLVARKIPQGMPDIFLLYT